MHRVTVGPQPCRRKTKQPNELRKTAYDTHTPSGTPHIAPEGEKNSTHNLRVFNFFMPTIAELQAHVAATKSDASARNYRAALQRLADYLGSDSLSYQRLSPGFVADFGHYLLGCGLTPSSVGLFQRCIRALLKALAPADQLAQVKAAFAEVGSKNISATAALSPDQLRQIAAARWPEHPSLERIRDAYMYAIYSGGTTLEAMQSEMPESATLQQQQIIRRHRRQYRQDFTDYLSQLDPDHYRSGLTAISAMLQLQPAIGATNEADNYIAAARAIGIAPERIAASAAQPTPFTRQVVGADKINPRQRRAARQRVAHSLVDLRPRWYALRTFRQTADQFRDELNALAAQPDAEPLDTFMAPLPPTKPGTPPPPGSNVVQHLLFVHTDEANILEISRARQGVHLYTYRGTGRPAHIADADMKLFMLLSDAARDTIRYYFPEADAPAADFQAGQQVRVKIGPFTGLVGIIDRTRDSYKIVLKIETLGGAVITADLPAEFVEPL